VEVPFRRSRPAAMRVAVGQRDVTSLCGARRRRYLGLIEGLRWRERRHRAAPWRRRLAHHHCQPSSGGRCQRPAGSALVVQSGAPMRSVLGAELPVLLCSAGVDPQATPGLIGGPGGQDTYFCALQPGSPPPAALIARPRPIRGKQFVPSFEWRPVRWTGAVPDRVLYDPSKPGTLEIHKSAGTENCFSSEVPDAVSRTRKERRLACCTARYWDVALRRCPPTWSHRNNCNMVVQAESLMMAKEHFIEVYGPVRYTFSHRRIRRSGRAALDR